MSTQPVTTTGPSDTTCPGLQTTQFKNSTDNSNTNGTTTSGSGSNGTSSSGGHSQTVKIVAGVVPAVVVVLILLAVLFWWRRHRRGGKWDSQPTVTQDFVVNQFPPSEPRGATVVSGGSGSHSEGVTASSADPVMATVQGDIIVLIYLFPSG